MFAKRVKRQGARKVPAQSQPVIPTAGSPTRGAPRFGARVWPWILPGIGLAGAVFSVLALRGEIRQAAQTEFHPDLMYARWAEQYERQQDWPRAFWCRQRMLETAMTFERRTEAGVDMVRFLLDVEGPVPPPVRWKMAREYVLALMDRHPGGDTQCRIWEYSMRISAAARDQDLWRRAAAWRELNPPDREPPFSALLAEWDARWALDDPVRGQWSRMEDAARSPAETDEIRLRQALMLGRVMHDSTLLSAAAERENATDLDGLQAMLLARWESAVTDMEASRVARIRSEAPWHRARIYAWRGETEAEIEALFAAVEQANPRVMPLAVPRLIERLRSEDRHSKADEIIGRMLRSPEMTPYAIAALQQRLGGPLDGDTLPRLLDYVDRYVSGLSPEQGRSPELLQQAAQAAAGQGYLDRADGYLQLVEPHSIDRRAWADLLLSRAELARHRGDRESVVRYAEAMVAAYPGHPREADARFLWFEEVGNIPFSEGRLIMGITEAVIRNPRDERTLEGLLLVARRLEEQGLFEAAKSHYRRAVLLSSVQQPAETTPSTAMALLGQARMLLRMGRDREADPLLRAMTMGDYTPDLRAEAGLLWSTVALREGQHVEAVRRWRETAGPPGDPLVAYLFGVLVPDAADLAFRWPSRPREAVDIVPPELIKAAADAAVDLLLRTHDFDGLDRLFTLAEQDPAWRLVLPLPRYRIRALEHRIAEGSVADVAAWLKRQGVEVSEAQRATGIRSPEEWAPLLADIESACKRLRESVY